MKKLFLVFVLLATALSAKEPKKECNGWHNLKWGSSLDDAQTEVKAVLGNVATLTLDPKDNEKCIAGYFYESSDNKEYVFRFLKQRLYEVEIWYSGYLDPAPGLIKIEEMPKPFLQSLEEKFGKRIELGSMTGNTRIIIHCTSKWDGTPAEIKIDAMTCGLPEPVMQFFLGRGRDGPFRAAPRTDPSGRI